MEAAYYPPVYPEALGVTVALQQGQGPAGSKIDTLSIPLSNLYAKDGHCQGEGLK